MTQNIQLLTYIISCECNTAESGLMEIVSGPPRSAVQNASYHQHDSPVYFSREGIFLDATVWSERYSCRYTRPRSVSRTQSSPRTGLLSAPTNAASAKPSQYVQRDRHEFEPTVQLASRPRGSDGLGEAGGAAPQHRPDCSQRITQLAQGSRMGADHRRRGAVFEQKALGTFWVKAGNRFPCLSLCVWSVYQPSMLDCSRGGIKGFVLLLIICSLVSKTECARSLSRVFVAWSIPPHYSYLCIVRWLDRITFRFSGCFEFTSMSDTGDIKR